MDFRGVNDLTSVIPHMEVAFKEKLFSNIPLKLFFLTLIPTSLPFFISVLKMSGNNFYFVCLLECPQCYLRSDNSFGLVATLRSLKEPCFLLALLSSETSLTLDLFQSIFFLEKLTTCKQYVYLFTALVKLRKTMSSCGNHNLTFETTLLRSVQFKKVQ